MILPLCRTQRFRSVNGTTAKCQIGSRSGVGHRASRIKSASGSVAAEAERTCNAAEAALHVLLARIKLPGRGYSVAPNRVTCCQSSPFRGPRELR